MKQVLATNFLARLIQINTAGGNEKPLADFLARQFKNHQIDCKLIPVENNRSDLVAQIGSGEKPVIALSGHLDTVAIGNRKKWTFPPLGGYISHKQMYGRGTSDMKAGLAAEILAMFNLKADHLPTFGTLRLLATVGEETSPKNHMQGAKKLVEKGYLSDVCDLIIAEPFHQAIYPAHKGSLTYQIKSRGQATHSSTPQLGYNAITPLVGFYSQQQKYFTTLQKQNKFLGKTVPVVTQITGGKQLNTVPDYASLVTKIRTIPEIKNQKILHDLRCLIKNLNEKKKAQLTLTVLGNKAPVLTNPHSKLVKTLQAQSQICLDQKLPVAGLAAGTDASEFIVGNPKLNLAILGPGNATAHKINEYVSLKNFLAYIKLYQSSIQKLLG